MRGFAKDGSDTLLAKYRYDGLGRRIAKLRPGGDDWDRTDYYYNDSWQCLEERTETVDDETTPADDVKIQYVWDRRYIDAPVLRWRDTDGNGSLDETLYYCNDANMNVTALVDATDGSQTEGEVVERYLYSPYGQPEFHDKDWNQRSSSAYSNEILFCGYRYDPETRLYQVRYRYYHPTLGRWAGRDPIGYGDGMNMFEYAKSSPRRFIDPFGMRCGDCCPPADAKDNHYDVQVSDPKFVRPGADPNTTDSGDFRTGTQIVSNARAVGSVGGGISGAMAKGGSVVAGAAKGATETVARKGMSDTGAAFDAYDEMKENMTAGGANYTGILAVDMWVTVTWKSCDPCTPWNPFLWFGAVEHEMRDHEAPFRCTRGTDKKQTNPQLGTYSSEEFAQSKLSDCRQEAEGELRHGRLK